MNFADRIALIWAAFLNLLAFVLYAPGDGFAAYVSVVTSPGWLRLMFFAVVPVWAFLRLLGWAFRPRRVS